MKSCRIFFGGLAIFVGVFLLSVHPVSAQYAASNVVGQMESDGSGNYNTNINDNIRLSAGFDNATGLAVDTVNHRLYVASGNDNAILVFNLNTDNTLGDKQADYIIGQENFGQLSTGVTQNLLSLPRSLSLDVSGQRLFVADSQNNRVLVFDVSTMANYLTATAVLGQPNFTSNTGSRSQSSLDSPQGVFYDSERNYLFVGDNNNKRVMVFDVAAISNGENAINVLGQADFSAFNSTPSQNTLSAPQGVLVDQARDWLLVADSTANRVLIFDIATITNGENAINVLGQTDFSSTGSSYVQSSTPTPYSLSYNTTSKQLYVGGFRRITIFDITAVTDNENAVNVLGQTDFVSSSATVNQATLFNPTELFVNATTNQLFTTDRNNNRVLIFDVASITNGENATDIIGQTLSNGTADYTSTYARNNREDARATGFGEANDVEVDTTNHRLFVADEANNRVLVFNLDSDNNLVDRTADYVLGQSTMATRDALAGAGGLNFVKGLAYDADTNYLYVADAGNNRVVIYDVASITNGENAINVIGQANFSNTSSGTTATTLNNPFDLMLDTTNNLLYVAENSNHRITVFDIATISDGEAAVKVLGQPDFTTTEADAYNAASSAITLFFPAGLALDTTDQKLYVACQDNSNRVLVYDVASITNGEAAVNVLGQTTFTGNASGLTNSTFDYPEGVAVDSTRDRLFVSDANNNRVLVFDVASVTNGEAAVAVLGQTDYVSKVNDVSVRNLYNPGRLFFDGDKHRLYTADQIGARVVMYDFVQITTSSLVTGQVSVAYSQSLASQNSQGTLSYVDASGSLPSGLSLSSAIITGIPTVVGTTGVTFRATDTFSYGTFWDDAALSLSIQSASSASSSNSSNSNSAGSSNASCTQVAPNSTAMLFQIVAEPNKAMLYFTPVRESDNYHIIYGFKPGEERFATQTNRLNNDGVIKWEIGSLKPNTTYAFKVKAARGCSAGADSNTFVIKTPRKNKTTFYWQPAVQFKNNVIKMVTRQK